ncbi:hypothetical protein BARVI_09445 [Barnesiella viscericola DSM 18177]|uniref:Uncharacterized protein n=1 Tax=Barnesiella viscericola DSM 18177 TaxID=880074 RepID=W0ESU2_9BACT|nr:hypothetical protein [Barnesiella viscericola]AHF13895.1 hypothetical protein BARVI_09445 [Barnesiella viscericola DSM 18177]
MDKRQIIGIILACAIFLPALGVMPYRTVLRKADDHFVNAEWRDALALYDTLLERRPGRVKTYVDAVVASAMLGDSAAIMRYVVRSEMQGLSLDSLFSGIDALSRSIGQTGAYEQVLLLVKSEQPWFTRVANNYLLGYYEFRRDAEHTLAIADELLAVMPRQVSYLKSKANALLLAGQNDSAAVVQQSILQVDSLDFDANLFLGSYYAVKGEERLDSIDERYLETLGQSTRPVLLYREEKREVLDTDIARARHYFTVAMGIRSNRYLSDQRARLEALTDELPQSGGTTIPLLKRLKQE